MTNYDSFLRNRNKMERSIGRYIVEMTEKGYGLSHFTNPVGIAVQMPHPVATKPAHTAIIKGTDRDLISAVCFCGLSQTRRIAAIEMLSA